MHFYTLLLLLLQPSVLCKATAKVNFARIWCITNPTPARRVTFTLKRLHGKIWPRLRGQPGLVDRATRLGRSPHLSCQRDQIKMRDYMDRRVTPPKRVTSPTWGPPPPCKQALREVLRQQVRQSVNFISTVIIIFLSFTSFTIIWPRLFKIWIALSTGWNTM